MRVVLDSNVFISAFETAGVLRRKFDQAEDDIKQALRQISRAAVVSKPVSKLRVADDEADNRILECARDARADLVVTGDRHLLKPRRFEGIPIVRLADFLRLFLEVE
jgi:predicted nucleic acid-binding protein